jgi:hypothetical protein
MLGGMNQDRLPLRRGKPRHTRAEIQTLVQDYQSSGLTQRAFAAQHQLSVSNLRYWLARAKRQAVPKARPQLLEVNIPESTKPTWGRSGYQIVVSGGMVKVPAGFDPAELEVLLQVLGSQA